MARAFGFGGTTDRVTADKKHGTLRRNELPVPCRFIGPSPGLGPTFTAGDKGWSFLGSRWTHYPRRPFDSDGIAPMGLMENFRAITSKP